MCSPEQPAKLVMLLLLALLLLCNGVGNVHCLRVRENNEDLHALLDFKQAVTNDPKRALISNWSTGTHFCRWNGITCTPMRPWRVMELNLNGLSLTGKMSSSLGNLTFLNTLDLSNNNFFGDFSFVGNLKKLETLYLSSNQFQGIIPDALANCSNLNVVGLDSNHLEGAIPPKLDSLSNLEFLNLGRNNLTGTIPPTLGNITSLEIIYLDANQLEGSIPDKLVQLPNLITLSLSGNRLTGEIPKTLHTLPPLQYLFLDHNMLGNVLPPNIGDTFPNLVELALGSNRFEGHIPASLGTASQLEKIDLSDNKFTGRVPSSLGMLSNLSVLNLQMNNLEARDNQGWEFLHSLRNCKHLKRLFLSKNQLEGDIPISIGDLSPNLKYLILGGNNLSGEVPPSIGNLRGLLQLSLDFNNLHGTIDEWVEKLTNLQILNLQVNNFTGSIPSSISHLTNLTKLSLAKNALEGPIPFSLGNLSGLLQLNLSYNNLQGIIPPAFSNLKGLTNLDLSVNKLTGEIPDALGQCKNLVNIHLDTNFLNGNIPISFGDLKSLNMLNLSHNNLSGNIPTTLNDLFLLIKLDLSYNHLQGAIPMTGVFANATAVSLEGNVGLCGGVMDLHMPSCKSVPRRTKREYYLVRVLIPIFGFMSLVLVVYFLILEKKKPRGRYISSDSFGENFLKVSYNDLAQATKNFSECNLVGRGSYGSVYRAKLKEYTLEVAVKVFDLEMRGAERSFVAECEALRSIQHRNLLPILTACSTVDHMGNVFKALVYEYMPNGNLDNWIHHKEGDKAPKHLGLSQTISICVNIADALDYLHHECGRTIIHCDLKPSNILLADDMNALLGDFGIARFYMDSWSTSTGSASSVGVKGTIGYIPPEYAGGGHPSTSGDVYGFGIVLLELMTGKRPTDPMFKDGLDIVNFVGGNFPHQILQVIDTRLTEECKDLYQANMTPGAGNAVYQCLVSLLQVALSCTHHIPSERMNMKLIAHKMHGIKTSYLGWKAKKYASPE